MEKRGRGRPRSEQRERAERSDKKINVNPKLDQHIHDLLKDLAFSVDMTKTELAATILRLFLENDNAIQFIQDRFNKDRRKRVIPSRVNGKRVLIFRSEYEMDD